MMRSKEASRCAVNQSKTLATSKEALEKHYLHEPAHQEFVGMLGGVLEKALVVDYVAG